MDIFQDGQPVDLYTVLSNREWRSAFQMQLQNKYPNDIVISVKLNVPGPIKNSSSLQDVFQNGIKRFQSMLTDFQTVSVKILTNRMTGPEAFLVVMGELDALKEIAIIFESELPIGRLFDVDVLTQKPGVSLSRRELGYPARKCLVCGNDAKTCIKLSAHTIQEGYQAIDKLYAESLNTPMTILPHKKDLVVKSAVASLLYEVSVTPKPGLVDPASNGAHDDMTTFTFIDSSLALMNYFNQAYDTGRNFSNNDLSDMFLELRKFGVCAEQTMFSATNGVNTHKGAIFSLGILVAAVGYSTRQGVVSVQQLKEVVQRMMKNILNDDLQKMGDKKVLTAGEKQYQKYHLTGVRGEASLGFPVVMDFALPFLQRTTGKLNQRFLDTLMFIAGEIHDTNLIKRAGGDDITFEMKRWVERYFSLGGSTTTEGHEYLEKLDKIFIERHLSMGGAADNLILTIFLGKISGVV